MKAHPVRLASDAVPLGLAGPTGVVRRMPQVAREWAASAMPRLATRWSPPRHATALVATVVLSAYAILMLLTGGPASGYRAAIALPLVAAAFLPSYAAAAVVGSALAVAVGPLALDRLWPDARILAPGTQVAVPALIPELFILLMVFIGLRLVVQVRDARRDAAGARRIAEATARNAEIARGRVEAILALSEKLAETFDRHAIFHILVAELHRSLATDAATIRIVDGDTLRVEASAGLGEDVVGRLPDLPRDEAWFDRLVASRRPLVIEEVDGSSPDLAACFGHAGSLVFRAAIVVPLFRDDGAGVVGALAALSARRREWSADEVDFAAAVATHASIALRNADLFARTQAWAAQLGVVQAASARLSRQNTIESVGRAIVEETRSIIDYHNCRVYLFEPPDDLRPIAFEGRVGAYEKVEPGALRVKLGMGFTGWVAQHGEPLLIPDANADPRGQTIAGTDDVDESMVVVPMRYDERLVGVITLSKLGLGQFDDDHVRLMTILADQAATALESARLLGRSQALARELGQLQAMGSELAQSLDPRQVADLIARHLADAFGADECAISYWDRPGDRILTLGYHPFHRRDQVDAAYSLESFPETRRVLIEQVAVEVRADDPAADTSERELLAADGDAQTLMLPLVAKGESVGLVELISKQAVRFESAQLQLARTMADEAAMALENARLYEDARMLADRDPLTGFLNHRSLHERLGEEIVRAQRSRSSLGLLMLDLDDFKLVNDTFGHQFGDRVLLWAAELIRSTLRASDVAARYGGDEFAVLLPDTDLEPAQRAADRIVEAFVANPYLAEGHGPVPVAVSIGCAAFPRDARSAVDLIATADAILYAVKKAGGSEAEIAPAERRRPGVAGQRGQEALEPAV